MREGCFRTIWRCTWSFPHNVKVSPAAVSAASDYRGFLLCFKQFHHATPPAPPTAPSPLCTLYALQWCQFVRVWIPIMELLKLSPVACNFLLGQTLKSTDSYKWSSCFFFVCPTHTHHTHTLTNAYAISNSHKKMLVSYLALRSSSICQYNQQHEDQKLWKRKWKQKELRHFLLLLLAFGEKKQKKQNKGKQTWIRAFWGSVFIHTLMQ